MKKFILIFVSLFLVNAYADSAEDAALRASELKQKTCEAATSIKYDCLGGNQAATGTTGTGQSISCKNYQGFLAGCGSGGDEEGAACIQAHKDFKEEHKSQKTTNKELEDDIIELEKDRAENKKTSAEEINRITKEIGEADTALQEEIQAITDEQTAAGEEADEELVALNKDYNDNVTAYTKNITVERTVVERNYKSALEAAYAKCDDASHKKYAELAAANRASARAANEGKIKSGGTKSKRQLKAEVLKFYKQCIATLESDVNNARTAKIEELDDAKNTLKTNIEAAVTALEKYYQKQGAKGQAFANRLKIAHEKNAQTKNALSQEKMALETASREEFALIEKQIASKRAQILVLASTKRKSREREEGLLQGAFNDMQSACCEGNAIRPELVRVKGVPSASNCAKKSITSGGNGGTR